METSLGSKRPNPRQRELPVSLFLSGLPTWAAAILLVIAPTIAAMCGPVLMRRRVGLERLTSNNEIAGFKFATVGVIYAADAHGDRLALGCGPHDRQALQLRDSIVDLALPELPRRIRHDVFPPAVVQLRQDGPNASG